MNNLSEEEYPLLETKEMSDRKKELEKLNKENIIQKLIGTEETLKFYIDLYNKEKEKNAFGVVSKDKINNIIKKLDNLEIRNHNLTAESFAKNILKDLSEETNE